MPGAHKPVVRDNFLSADATHIPVGSRLWYEWLSTAKHFSYKSPSGCFVAQCETRRGKTYWYAYRRRAGKLFKSYLGKTEELTPERLEQTSLSLAEQTFIKQRMNQPGGNENFSIESRIDTSFLPITKVNVPVLPRQLVSRTRLTRQINTPLTLIYAPSGFGKSTLLNDWKQTCGHPVAWLSLDESDNQVLRFWYSVIMALQTVDHNFGMELLAYLRTTSSIRLPDIISRLTNDIVSLQVSCPRVGLVLDDFHRINQTEIYDSLQAWLEHLPSNMQLVILGHTKPPLSLGHLRAKGLVTELDANDLRFTLEEGVHYLRQYQQEPPLAYDDITKLVKHAEGWAAGLTLTALALGKQENRRQFVDTFSGAHIYMREYFMETVLQRSSPEVQSFLLKTAILKHLNGSLCDALTGQTGGDEMLSHLWHENLFIVRLEEQGWYRYHDLFAEMLLSELEARFPNEISQLHQRAAQWYRERYAPADAIYHLLATQAWEEAALLLEEMALRELEQYGEDSRLLRCLQELPARVVQQHKTLLLVYLWLADVALPEQTIERFITHIEADLSMKPDFQQTPDEREVLVEIQKIRHAWEQGDPFTAPTREDGDNDTRWELLKGLHLFRHMYGPNPELWEEQIADLLHKAQSQGNLFVILMAGGVLARRMLIRGQLRRSEKIIQQALEQALARRVKLPETASIVLAVLSQIHLERNELELAQKYLAEALDVDPNPTSTNMLVQVAIQRAKIQMMQGNFVEALANMRSIRALHLRRPSAVWNDQDLLAYEAYVYLRMGELSTAEQTLNESESIGDPSLSELMRAEILLAKKQPETAEKRLNSLLTQYPNGLTFEPLMRTRVLLAQALFDQHKLNQALHVMREAIRLAAPERFLRPFLEGGPACIPLLSLTLQTENLTSESQSFVKDLLLYANQTGGNLPISQAEIDALSTSASISPREQEVLCLIGLGCSNYELAQKLSISESTVKTHLSNIYKKLDVSSRVQAVARAKGLGVIP